MPKPIPDLTGQTFNLLTVVSRAANDSGNNVRWTCLCKCGKTTPVRGTHLRSGQTRSCGCIMPAAVSKANIARLTTHNESGSLTGVSWMRMMQRCSNPKAPDYACYGARGITPCPFIAASPLNLISVVGRRLRQELSIDRINNELGYNCGQCPHCLENGLGLNIRWSTAKVQTRNRRSTRHLTAFGKTLSVAEWVERVGIPRNTLMNRIQRGWSIEKALTP